MRPLVYQNALTKKAYKVALQKIKEGNRDSCVIVNGEYEHHFVNENGKVRHYPSVYVHNLLDAGKAYDPANECQVCWETATGEFVVVDIDVEDKPRMELKDYVEEIARSHGAPSGMLMQCKSGEALLDAGFDKSKLGSALGAGACRYFEMVRNEKVKSESVKKKMMRISGRSRNVQRYRRSRFSKV